MQYFIGWDVGGWNCDRNRCSRDAIVILSSDASQVVGAPWRGNLRQQISEAKTAMSWLTCLFTLCRVEPVDAAATATVAIDTPLGFSSEFVRLVSKRHHHELGSQPSFMNPYLFRRTERHLFERGHKSLSAVKDMIGSQATKGMHVLAKFGLAQGQRGVWTCAHSGLTVIETYPAACRNVPLVSALRSRLPVVGHTDEEDALCCALVAFLFSQHRQRFAAPPDDVPECEGWIWLPPEDLSEHKGSEA